MNNRFYIKDIKINKVALNKGFSIIELMIVLIIMGVLAAIALPLYQKYLEKADLADASTVLMSANQNIAKKKLTMFSGNISENDIKKLIILNQNLTKKFTAGAKCGDDKSAPCSSYILYADPKSGTYLKKGVWISSKDSVVYYCKRGKEKGKESLSTITDASKNNNCSKQ